MNLCTQDAWTYVCLFGLIGYYLDAVRTCACRVQDAGMPTSGEIPLRKPRPCCVGETIVKHGSIANLHPTMVKITLPALQQCDEYVAKSAVMAALDLSYEITLDRSRSRSTSCSSRDPSWSESNPIASMEHRPVLVLQLLTQVFFY